MIDWQDLQVLTLLARNGSLSAAARELGVEHATIGRRIDSLEKNLGLRLVDRLPRSRPLTKDGLAVAALAQNMAQQAALIEQRSRMASAGLAGVVRVSVPPSLARACIAPKIARLNASHPDLQLVLLPGTALAALNKGEADVAIRSVRPEDDGLIRKRIGAVRFGLYGTAKFSRHPPEDWTFISYDQSLDHLPQQMWLHRIRSGRRIAFFASDLLTQQIAASNHIGAVVLPTIIGERDTVLIQLPTNEAPPVRDIWLTAYPGVKRSPVVNAVIDFLIACVEEEPLLADRT